MNIRLAFLTGTGSTRHVARCFEAEFNVRGQDVETEEIRHGNISPTGNYDLLLLCFPVHAGCAPQPVIDWIKKLPRDKGKRAALISVSAGGEKTPNLACRVRAKGLLKSQGFDVFYEKMLIMPSNWGFPTPQPLIDPILNILPFKVAYTAHKILDGQKRLIAADPVNRIIALMGRLEHIGARKFGKSIRSNENCTGCGLCARSCPVGNIKLKEGIPSFGDKCIMCMACLYCCPTGAIYPTHMKFARLPGGYDIKKMLKEKKPGFSYTPDKETKKWKGLEKYLAETEDMEEPAAGE